MGFKPQKPGKKNPKGPTDKPKDGGGPKTPTKKK